MEELSAPLHLASARGPAGAADKRAATLFIPTATPLTAGALRPQAHRGTGLATPRVQS